MLYLKRLTGFGAAQSLGGDATSGQTFTAESTNDGAVSNLFDDNNSTVWGNGSADTTWVQVQFSSAKAVGAYSIRATATGDFDRCPITWTLVASDTGSFSGEEVTIDSQTSVSAWSSGERREYSVANITSYTYYRLNCLAKTNALGKLSEYYMAEVELFAYV